MLCVPLSLSKGSMLRSIFHWQDSSYDHNCAFSNLGVVFTTVADNQHLDEHGFFRSYVASSPDACRLSEVARVRRISSCDLDSDSKSVLFALAGKMPQVGCTESQPGQLTDSEYGDAEDI